VIVLIEDAVLFELPCKKVDIDLYKALIFFESILYLLDSLVFRKLPIVCSYFSYFLIELKWEKINIDLYKALTDQSIDALNKTTRTVNDTEHLPEKICTIMNEAATKSTTVKAKYSAKFVIVLLNTLSLCRTCS
jgi:hypothetical protein